MQLSLGTSFLVSAGQRDSILVVTGGAIRRIAVGEPFL